MQLILYFYLFNNIQFIDEPTRYVVLKHTPVVVSSIEVIDATGARNDYIAFPFEGGLLFSSSLLPPAFVFYRYASGLEQFYTSPYKLPLKKPTKENDSMSVKGEKNVNIKRSDNNISITQSTYLLIHGYSNGISIDGYLNDFNSRTLYLRDVEGVYIRLGFPAFSLTVGDFETNYRFIKEDTLPLRGVKIKTHNNTMFISGVNANTNTIYLDILDGISGPYHITDKSITNIRIYAGNRLLIEGEDYFIDYSLNDVYFYLDRLSFGINRLKVIYSSSLVDYPSFEAGITTPYISIYGFREAFNPYKYDFSPDEIAILKDEEDTIVKIPSITNNTRGDYVENNGHYIYVGKDKGNLSINFGYVGINKGEYRYVEGYDYYEYVGEGMGMYSPYRYIHPPQEYLKISLRKMTKTLISLNFKLYTNNRYRGIYNTFPFLESKATLNFDDNRKIFINALYREVYKEGYLSPYYDYLSDTLFLIQTGLYLNRWVLAFEWTGRYLLNLSYRNKGDSIKVMFSHFFKQLIVNKRLKIFDIGAHILSHDSLFYYSYAGIGIDKFSLRVFLKKCSSTIIGIRTNVNFPGIRFNIEAFDNIITDSLFYNVYGIYSLSYNNFLINTSFKNILSKSPQYIIEYHPAADSNGNYSFDPETNTFYPDENGIYEKILLPGNTYTTTYKRELNLYVGRMFNKGFFNSNVSINSFDKYLNIDADITYNYSQFFFTSGKLHENFVSFDTSLYLKSDINAGIEKNVKAGIGLREEAYIHRYVSSSLPYGLFEWHEFFCIRAGQGNIYYTTYIIGKQRFLELSTHFLFKRFNITQSIKYKYTHIHSSIVPLLPFLEENKWEFPLNIYRRNNMGRVNIEITPFFAKEWQYSFSIDMSFYF